MDSWFRHMTKFDKGGLIILTARSPIMTSNRSSLFSSASLHQRISIKALNFIKNLRSIKYSLRKWSIKNSFPRIIDNELKARIAEWFSVHNKVRYVWQNSITYLTNNFKSSLKPFSYVFHCIAYFTWWPMVTMLYMTFDKNIQIKLYL